MRLLFRPDFYGSCDRRRRSALVRTARGLGISFGDPEKRYLLRFASQAEVNGNPPGRPMGQVSIAFGNDVEQ